MTTPDCGPLIWDDAVEWAPQLERVLPAICNKSVFDRLKHNQTEFLVEDDLEWLGCLLPGPFRSTDDLRYEIFSGLRKSFTHLVAYHGCRPLDLRTYQGAGIEPLDTSAAHDALVRRVCGVSANGPTEEAVRSACLAADRELREGRIYFELNARFLVDFCGHYLLYGSEYVVGILRSISDDVDHAQLLKLKGKPTLLKCHVPLDWLSEGTQGELASNLISRYFKLKLDSEYVDPRQDDRFGFAICRTLPPELIVDVSYPENIRDPIVPGSITFPRTV